MKMTKELENQPPDCDCWVCQEMCTRPCGPTPKEARALIDAGFANCLEIKEGWAGNGEVDMLGMQKIWLWGEDNLTCIFYDGNHCKIHGDLKPLEGRMAHHSINNGYHRSEHLYPSWDTDEGRSLIEK
jgi:hypothetical protein